MMVYGACDDPVAGQGYLVKSYPFSTDVGFQIGNITANVNEASAQIVSRPGSGIKSSFFIHYNVRPKISANKISGTANAFTVAEIKDSNTIDLTAVQSMTFTLKGATTANGTATDCDSYAVTTPTGTLFSATGVYKNGSSDTTTNNTHIIGYGNNFGDAEIYAVRYYDRAIDAAEEKQNHLVDLLKYFRIDLGYIKLLDAAHLANVAEAAKALTFDDDFDKVEATILTAAKTQAEAQFSGFDANLFAVLAKYGLDVTPFEIYPLYYLKHARDFLISGYLACENADEVATAYEAALDADYLAMWNADGNTESAYNALYVQDSIAIGLDFFKMNSYWNPEGEGHIDYVVPLGPSQNSAYTVGDTTYDFTNATVRTENFDSVFKDAVADWQTAYKNFLNGFVWTDGTMKFSVYRNGTAKNTETERYTSVVDAADGYMQFRSDYYSSGGMVFSSIPSSTAVTGQLVMEYSGTYSSTRVPFLFHNIRPQVTVAESAGAAALYGFANTQMGGSKYSDEKDEIAPINTSFTMTQSLSLVSDTEEVKDNYSLRINDTTAISISGQYGAAVDQTLDVNTYYIGWGSVQPQMRMYAFRQYNKVLSDDEVRQNHVADILKFYKLDLRGIDLATMADDLYAFFADVTFTSHTRRELQDMLAGLTLEAATADYEAKYDAYYETDIPAAYIELGRLYGLELDILTEGLPRGYLTNTYKLLDELVAKQYTEPDGVNAAARLAAAYELDCSTYVLSDMTAEDYNALFVQDGMVAGIDFYFTNEYWTNTPVTSVKNTGTATATVAAAKALLDSYRYSQSQVTFANVKMPAGATLTIKDGYLDLAGITGEFNFSGVEAKMNYGVNGSSVELVRAVKRATYLPVLNSLRIYMSSDGNVGTLYNGGYVMYTGANVVTASNKLGTPLKYEDFQSVHTYTMNMQRDEITFGNAESLTNTFRAKNPGKITDYYTSTGTSPVNYYTDKDVYTFTTDAEGKVTVDLGAPLYTVEEHGTDVNLATTKGGAVSSVRVIATRNYPAKPIIPDYITDADGNTTENTEGKAYWVGAERFVDGAFSIYQDGTMLYDNDSAEFINNGYYEGSDSFIVLWGNDAGEADNSGKFYAARYYGKDLTPAEQAQNHFVDLAKFYRLDLTEYLALDADARAAVHTAFADFTVAESDRAALEYAYQKAVQAQLTAAYEAIEAENAEIAAKNAAFFMLAAEYRLDLAQVLASDRDIDYVVENVTADALVGMDFAEADAYLADLYYDAYYYIPYLREGADKWNAWLGKLVDGDVRAETETLMKLPQAEREGVLKQENNTDAAVITAYAEARLAQYAASYGNMTLEDYDALYAGLEASLISLDFFKTNEYWGMSNELPTPPYEETEYRYDGKTYNFTEAENRLMQANENWAITTEVTVEGVTQKSFAYRNKNGVWAVANANYPATTNVTDDFTQNMPRQTFTAEEIDEKLESAKAGLPGYTLEKVQVPLWIIWRETVSSGVKDFYTVSSTFTGGSARVVKVYMTEDAALTDAATLAGEGATVADGVYTSADGKYQYYAAVRPIATAEYYQCIADYGSKVVTDYIYAADIGDSRTVGFAQNMTTIGELTSYQSQTGLDHMYSHVSFKNGYMELDCTHTGPYFSLTSIPTAKGSTVYFDSLFAGGDKDATSTKAITFQGANLLFTINDAGTTLATVGGKEVGLTAAGRNTPFRLEIASTATADNTATFKITLNNNAETAKTVDVATSTQSLIGHSHASAARIYTYRIYNRVLTEAEQLQNHFMDLAKYYRIDLTEYKAATAEQKAATHALFENYEVGSTTREELLFVYNSADYTAAEAVLSTEMMDIVRELGIDVVGLVNADAATRAYVESVVLADFKAGMPMETKVVQAVIDQAILYKDAFAFEGVQVRLHSSTKGDIPGVRAIFAVDKNQIASYAASGRDVAFGVEICDKYGNALAVLYFSADAEAECGYAGTNTLVSKQTSTPAIIQAVGENSLAFAYTVIFENKDGVNAQTAAYYNTEFGYRFFVEVDGLRNVQEALVLGTFGETVSATEAYRHFYNVEGLTEDATVNMVINEVGAAD